MGMELEGIDGIVVDGITRSGTNHDNAYAWVATRASVDSAIIKNFTLVGGFLSECNDLSGSVTFQNGTLTNCTDHYADNYPTVPHGCYLVAGSTVPVYSNVNIVP
jgi:hypothetical protein